jgi:D-glycero-alpha-D-manno-heptose-7-phosphate kinase
MITRARAPLRLGLAGGGTDLSPYCDEFGGAVLNATIDRYAYAFLEAAPDDHVHFVAHDVGISESFPASLEAVRDARLALHAGVWSRMMRDYYSGPPLPLRITSFVDAPPGSGLGSSSALGVALVEAFRAHLDLPLGLYEVAHLAYEIERVDMQLPGGRQDQYAATFGGTNFIEFLPGGRVIVNPLRVSRACLNEFETSLVICFSGISRSSEQIIEEQQRRMTLPSGNSLHSLHQLKRDAVGMKQALLRGEIGHMARVLNRSWEAKKRTAEGISTSAIEQLYETALGNGAQGGKVSGAGGGGFLMFIVPPERRTGVISALNAGGAQASAVHLTNDGSESWTVGRKR